jgi:hypothetical protein
MASALTGERAGVEAKLGFKAHPHMLRRVRAGLQGTRHPSAASQSRTQEYPAPRYTELTPDRFKDFWR